MIWGRTDGQGDENVRTSSPFLVLLLPAIQNRETDQKTKQTGKNSFPCGDEGHIIMIQLVIIDIHLSIHGEKRRNQKQRKEQRLASGFEAESC